MYLPITSVTLPLLSSSCRYGLYSSPFDPVLFDLEVSGSSCRNAFNSSIGVQSDEIDLSDILSGISFSHAILTNDEVASDGKQCI